jgi:hypothetical protein
MLKTVLATPDVPNEGPDAPAPPAPIVNVYEVSLASACVPVK